MLALIALSVAVSVTAATPDPTSEQALVEEAWRAAKDDALLDPPPADPIPGSFADRALPALSRLEKLWHDTFGGPEKGALQGVLDGLEPYESLPAPTRAVVEKALPDALQVLAATHARSGRLPVGLTGFIPIHEEVPGWAGLLAAKLAGIEIRRELAGHQGAPMGLCVDALAVGREYSGGNLLARMFSVSIARSLVPICLDVVAAAPPSCERLDSVLAGWQPMSRTMEQEKLFIELAGFGDTLGEKTREALPKAARHILGDASGERSRFGRLRWWLFGGWARADYVKAMNRVVARIDGPVDPANAALEALAKERPLSSWLLGDHGSTSWLGFARRDREARTRLTALADLCHWQAARTGASWPSPPPLGRDARTGRSLRAEIVDAAHVRILAEGDPKRQAERLVIELARPQATPAPASAVARPGAQGPGSPKGPDAPTHSG